MKQEVCENCFYWVRFKKQARTDITKGECHRRAPGAFQALEPGPFQGKVQTKWPSPESTEWCGEWKAKETGEQPTANIQHPTPNERDKR